MARGVTKTVRKAPDLAQRAPAQSGNLEKGLPTGERPSPRPRGLTREWNSCEETPSPGALRALTPPARGEVKIRAGRLAPQLSG
jgi:hypothetical protein